MRIIGGQFGGRSIKVIDAPGLRPATGRVREALFSMLTARGVRFPGAAVLDCFAGAGSVGIEALSRGAASAVFIENNPAVAKVLRDNLRGLGIGSRAARVVEADVAKALPRLAGRRFDLVAIDPPYGQGLLPPTLAKLASVGLVAEDGVIVAEIESGAELAAGDVPPTFDCLIDRTYGQTRIIVWTLVNPASPSTPEPSIP
ncbi:16S rRNA (guanine(966)-N(2))-methyltransferase RsmD [Desulfovibrio aerotolerans]|uniref:16S rRNA (Guanine(966)-N(2))-methyltransferase RsmD n=1 Tax=Solidesulfovibrio aerotolerans TaxID=295255 RepID=A0A7C9NIP0_9BACT|nr:16S rRNA (guanine(966)-N(2))-methyltransferase RsmD [Solidesulfovibrio aerotolerans]MYL82636.1 16S rRNA (guanine(966)-N(2))-methyltransferase RsmD [Solidesulfovibrio aerotolerans]